MVPAMRAVAVAILPLAGCLALGPKQPPRRGEAVLAGSIGVAVAAGTLVAAHQAHGASGKAIAAEAGFGTLGGVVMGMAMFGGEPDPEPTTEGAIYSALGRGLLDAFGASLTLVVPPLLTIGAGRDVEEVRDPERAVSGAFLGAAGGVIATLAVHTHLPKWARVTVGAVLIGSLTTLGYQLGGRGAK